VTQLHRSVQTLSELSTPVVQRSGDALLVDRLVVRDRSVVEYFASLPAERMADVASDAFVIGSRALAAAGGSATMAALNDHLESAVRNAQQNLTALPAIVKQQIDTLCEHYLGDEGAFVGKLDKDLQVFQNAFQPNGDVVTAIRDALAVEVRRRVAEALTPVTQALNVNNADGPLGLIHRNLLDLVTGQTELREQIRGAIRLQTQQDRSVHKGYVLEDFIGQCLGQLSSDIGDRFENCSRVPGSVINCKEGDFVSLVDPQITRGKAIIIAIEAKNRKSDTVASLCKLLTSVRDNRGATVAIGVLTNPAVTTRPIAMYGPDKIIVHLDGFGSPEAEATHRTLLEIAYYVARVQATALANGSSEQILDIGFLSDYLERIDVAITEFKTLGRNLTAIEGAVQKTRETADLLRNRVKGISEDLKLALIEIGKGQLVDAAGARSMLAIGEAS
jgi:hypothetical protein